jgi:RNA polymerase sigma-70 factor (ECF subfamily)
MEDAADALLIERVRRGDVAAFDAIVRRYERRAFTAAYRLLRHREDAEDLVQEAFLLALDKLHTFNAERPFAPWFFTLLANHGLNLRARRRVREVDELSDKLMAGDEGTERAIERAELRAHVEAAMEDLTERQRLVVQLHELNGWSSREVAEMLDIAEPTVRWTLHEARKSLRKALAMLKEDPHHE